MPNENWGTMHPSVFKDAGRLLRWTQASPRPHGAVRYRCPVTGSFVLVTDPATLEKLSGPHARIRCGGCREMHMLTREADGNPAVVVGRMGPA